MRPTRKVCNESQSSYKLAFNFRNLSVHPPRKYLKSASKAKISEHEISLVFPLTHPRSSLCLALCLLLSGARGTPCSRRARYAKTTGYKSGVSILALLKHNVPLKSKIAQPCTPPPNPEHSTDIWLRFYSYSRDFDPKWGPPSRTCDFRVKTPVSVSSQRILWFFHSACAPRSWVISPIFTVLLEHLRVFQKAC